METGKFRLAIITALVSFFAASLAFAGAHESAAPTEEEEVAIEAAAEDMAIAEEIEAEIIIEEEIEEEAE